MRTHTQDFKKGIKEYGREFEDTLYYTSNGTTTTYDGNHINSVSYSVDTSILKSVMQTLIIDSDLNFEIEDTISYGISLVGVTGSEIRFSNFIIKKKEEQKDTHSYRYTCYDKMIASMVDYESLDEYQLTEDTEFVEDKTYYELEDNDYVVYDGDRTGNPNTLGLYELASIFPLTIREYIGKICNKLGITFANSNDTFINYDKVLSNELYLDSNGNTLGYTFRDVLDELAQVTGSFICINDDDELEIRYITETTQPQSTLPSGYTELSYIESSGTQYIDTGMKLNQNSKVELKIKDVPTVGSMIMGSRSSATSNNFSILTGQVGGNASLVCDFQDYRNNRLSLNVNDIASNEFIIKVNNSKLEINDTSQNVSTYTNFTTPGNAYIFNGSGTYPTGYVKASTKLYYCKIWNGNTLVRNYIPCKNSSNVVGLYDLANNTFYQNAGTGSFTPGSEVVEVDTIDEEYFQDNNVNIGKKYGPINSLIFSRSADSDSIGLTDPESISENGLCEVKISDNQILNDNNRDEYLEELFEYLDGIYYYLNDFQTTGITYYEVGDLYNVLIDDTTYPCLMLNDNIVRDGGLIENIYTKEPTISVSDYNAISKTDKMVNKAYLIVNKQEGKIEGLVKQTNTIDRTVNNNYQELNDKFNGYVPTSQFVTLENSVTTLQTDTYTKTDVKSILKGTFYDENNNQIVSEIVHTTSGTFDENGMTYEKTNANTKTTINEVGVGVKKTDGSDDYILFAGYVDENNTQFSDFKGQTVVASDNLIVQHYLVVGSNSRMEDYDNGTGMFYIGG